MNTLNEKDKDTLRGLIKKILDQLRLHYEKEERILVPSFEHSTTNELYNFINKKWKMHEDIYDADDILSLVTHIIKGRLFIGPLANAGGLVHGRSRDTAGE